jgi:hypothetical protein
MKVLTVLEIDQIVIVVMFVGLLETPYLKMIWSKNSIWGTRIHLMSL